MFTCLKCGGEYGKTNLQYRGIEIWQGCYCQPVDKVYFLNMENIKMIEEIKDGNGTVIGAANYPDEYAAKVKASLEPQGVCQVIISFPVRGDAFGMEVLDKNPMANTSEGYSTITRIIARLRELAAEHKERQEAK